MTETVERKMDVVSRIRARADGVDQFYGEADEELDRAAIAEIKRLAGDVKNLLAQSGRQENDTQRLHAEISDLKERLATALDQLGKVSAQFGYEIERLRAALKPLAEYDPQYPPMPGDVEAARAALATER